MNIGDVLILGFVILWLILVFCYMKKRKESGKCLGCGGCGGCGGCDGVHCTHCTDKKSKKKPKQ